MKKLRKRQSKRQTCKQKHAIAKRSAKARSDSKRQLRKHPFVRQRKNNLIKIPNRVPYKGELLAAMERQREEEKQEKEERVQAAVRKAKKDKQVKKSIKPVTSSVVPKFEIKVIVFLFSLSLYSHTAFFLSGPSVSKRYSGNQQERHCSHCS
jgi:hypothetical protein